MYFNVAFERAEVLRKRFEVGRARVGTDCEEGGRPKGVGGSAGDSGDRESGRGG